MCCAQVDEVSDEDEDEEDEDEDDDFDEDDDEDEKPRRSRAKPRGKATNGRARGGKTTPGAALVRVCGHIWKGVVRASSRGVARRQGYAWCAPYQGWPALWSRRCEALLLGMSCVKWQRPLLHVVYLRRAGSHLHNFEAFLVLLVIPYEQRDRNWAAAFSMSLPLSTLLIARVVSCSQARRRH